MTKTGSPIALLGTSADPPTYGHQALLQGLLKLFPKVVTWASDNPMKNHGASLEKRHALLQALVKDIENPNLQLIQELSSPWTIRTLEKASECWPQAELVFIIGSDLAQQIPNWFDAKNILRKTRLGIAPREGWPIEESVLIQLKALGGEVDLLPLKIPASASSEFRKKPELSQIPTAILPIVLKQNLYGLATIS